MLLHNSVVLEPKPRKTSLKSDGNQVKDSPRAEATDPERESSSEPTSPRSVFFPPKQTPSCSPEERSPRFKNGSESNQQPDQPSLVFKIYSPNGKIQLLAPTRQARKEWVEDLSRLIQKQAEQHRTFLSTPLNLASSRSSALLSSDRLASLSPSPPPSEVRKTKERHSSHSAPSISIPSCSYLSKRTSLWARAYPTSLLAAPLPSSSCSCSSSSSSSLPSENWKNSSTTLSTSPTPACRKLISFLDLDIQSPLTSASRLDVFITPAAISEESVISLSSLIHPLESPHSLSHGTPSSPRYEPSQSVLSEMESSPSDKSCNQDTRLNREWWDDNNAEAQSMAHGPQLISIYRYLWALWWPITEQGLSWTFLGNRRRPEWVPDGFSSYCANCAAPFSLITRRVHSAQDSLNDYLECLT